jgi:hypothetical protein
MDVFIAGNGMMMDQVLVGMTIAIMQWRYLQKTGNFSYQLLDVLHISRGNNGCNGMF